MIFIKLINSRIIGSRQANYKLWIVPGWKCIFEWLQNLRQVFWTEFRRSTSASDHRSQAHFFAHEAIFPIIYSY